MTSYIGTITVPGNVTSEPVLKFSQGGKAYINFSMAITKRNKERDKEDTYFADVTAFGTLAENIGASITKGSRVLVYGEPDPQQWPDKENPEKTYRKLSIIAIDVAASLSFATVEIFKPERQQSSRPQHAAGEEPFGDPEETTL